MAPFWYSGARMAQKTVHTDLPENTHVLEPRVYEVGYLLVPSLREEDLDTHVDAIKDLIAQHKGLQIADDAPVLIDLAYEMTKVIDNKNYKFSQGYFGWIKFDLAPSALVDIKAALEKNPNIIRFLLISTVRDNTVFSKKLTYKSTRRIVDEGELAEDGANVEVEDDTTPAVVNLDLETNDSETGVAGATLEA